SFRVSTSPMRTVTLNSSLSWATASASLAPAFMARETTSAARDSRSRAASVDGGAGWGMNSNYQNATMVLPGSCFFQYRKYRHRYTWNSPCQVGSMLGEVT